MPVVKFFSWKLEKKLIHEEKEFSDGEVVVVLQCLKCGEMVSVTNFGFNCIIPGLAMYSSEVNMCSNCMDNETFNYMTSQ